MFLALIRAQEMLMLVRSFVCSFVRPFGPNLSSAVNLHHSRSGINQSTQGVIVEHSENT